MVDSDYFFLRLVNKKKDSAKLITESFFIVLNSCDYMASATTSVTSGTMRFNKPSIPAFNVIVEDGQPLQEPFSSTVTIPSLKDL
jgi:hypothetical protein